MLKLQAVQMLPISPRESRVRPGCRNISKQLSNSKVKTIQLYSFACELVPKSFQSYDESLATKIHKTLVTV